MKSIGLQGCIQGNHEKQRNMQILIEVMAERSEGVATNLPDKDFIEMLMLICKK